MESLTEGSLTQYLKKKKKGKGNEKAKSRRMKWAGSCEDMKNALKIWLNLGVYGGAGEPGSTFWNVAQLSTTIILPLLYCRQLHHFQSCETEKYDRKSSGTRKEELLCWRGPASIYPNRTNHFFFLLFLRTAV
jgi:hypothetical protein